jgi:hypothetical protein
MRTIVTLFIVWIIGLANTASAELLISEVLANEPGDRVLLEWIEIYNNGQSAEFLYNYRIINENDTLNIPRSIGLNAGNYAVICRRLIPIDQSDCFEYHWGDSSGVWRDSPIENYLAVEVPISLPNSSGDLYLIDSRDTIIDECHWQAASADGQSLERDDVNDKSSGWHPCADSTGSTPGRRNSRIIINQPENAFTVDSKVVSLSSAKPYFSITCDFQAGTILTIIVFDDSGRKRAVLADHSSQSSATIIWPCIEDSGKKLSPGLYILKFKAEGAANYSKILPLVIAP